MSREERIKKGRRTGTRVWNQSRSPAAEASEARTGSRSRKASRSTVAATAPAFFRICGLGTGLFRRLFIELLYDKEEAYYEKTGGTEAGKSIPVF